MSDGLKVSIWNRFPIKLPNLNIRNRNNFLCYWSKANVFATSFQIQKWLLKPILAQLLTADASSNKTSYPQQGSYDRDTNNIRKYVHADFVSLTPKIDICNDSVNTDNPQVRGFGPLLPLQLYLLLSTAVAITLLLFQENILTLYRCLDIEMQIDVLDHLLICTLHSMKKI